MKEETIILSLGGSLVVPAGGINSKFLINFNKFIRRHVKKGKRFFIVCGGGRTARDYIDGAVGVLGKDITDWDCDWLGIHATRINAHLIRTIFQDIAYPRIIDKYDRKYDVGDYSVVVGSGWKPGWSTDYDAVVLGKQYGAKYIINLSNIDTVYTKDPKKFKDAMPIEQTNWKFFCSLVGDKWSPGLSAPFDPIASKLAKKSNQVVIILNGEDLNNLEKMFKGEKFKGTVIGPATFDAGFFDRDYFEGGKGEYRGYKDKRFKYWLYKHVNMFRAFIIKIFINPKRVLDVGCGFGLLAHYLRKLGVDGWGVDISNYAVGRADENVRRYLKVGRIGKLPFKDNSFDLVVTYDVFEHVSERDVKNAIDECRRVSSKYCLHKIFTKENMWISFFHGLDLSHINVKKKGWWEKMFEKEGCKKASRKFLKLPLFMETMFLVEK